MIEAYEIGIRIALDDGVSAGVEAMARELAELNRVVDGSMMRLAVLREAAAALAPEAARAEPVQPPAPDEPVLAEAATRVAPATEAPDERRPVAPASVPQLQPASVAPEAEAPRSPVEKEPPASPVIVSDATVFVLPATPSAPPPALAQQAAPRTAEPGRLAPAPSPAPREKAAEPPRPIAPARTSPQARPPSPPDIVRGPAAPAADPARTSARPPEPSEPFQPPARQAAAVAPVVARPRPASGSRQANAFPPFASPQAAPESTAATQAPVAPTARGAAPARQSGAPWGAAAPTSSEQPPTSVHVYLDGAPLGRWIEDHLGRMAGRPQASTTGFDPRVGPTWPGAPTG